MNENVTRIINMSYAELISICDTVHAFMVRDSAEFAGYEVNYVYIIRKDFKIWILNLICRLNLSSRIIKNL